MSLFSHVSWGRLSFCFGGPTASLALLFGVVFHWLLAVGVAFIGVWVAGAFVVAELNRFRQLTPDAVRTFRAKDWADNFFFLEF